MFLSFFVSLTFSLPLASAEHVAVYSIDLAERQPSVAGNLRYRLDNFFASHPEYDGEVYYGDDTRVPYDYPVNGANGSVIAYTDITMGPWAPNIMFFYSYHHYKAGDELHDINALIDEVNLESYVPPKVFETIFSTNGTNKLEWPLVKLPFSLSCHSHALDSVASAAKGRGEPFDVLSSDFLHTVAAESTPLNLLPVVHSGHGSEIASMYLIRMFGMKFYDSVLEGRVSFTSPEIKAWAREVDRAHAANIFRNVPRTEYESKAMDAAICAFFPAGMTYMYFRNGSVSDPFVDVPFPMSPLGSLLSTCGASCPLDVIGKKIVATFPLSQPKEVAEKFVRWFAREVYGGDLASKYPTAEAWETKGPAPGTIRSELIPNTAEHAAIREAAIVHEKYHELVSPVSHSTNHIISEGLAHVLAPFFTQDASGNALPGLSFENELEALEVDRLSKLFHITAPVEFSLEPGVYKAQSITVELSSATPNARISYTTDGTDPSVKGLPYSGPITIHHRGETLIWAVAKGKDLLPSDPIAVTFVIDKLNMTLVLAVAIPSALVFIGALAGLYVCFRKKRVAGAEDHLIPTKDLDLKEIIGAGSNSIVYRAVLRESMDVAVKVTGSIGEGQRVALLSSSRRNSASSAKVDPKVSARSSKASVSSRRPSLQPRTVHSAAIITSTLAETEEEDLMIPGQVIQQPQTVKTATTDNKDSIIPKRKLSTTGKYGTATLASSTIKSQGIIATTSQNTVKSRILSMIRTTNGFSKAFSKELVILASLRHPNILLLYGFTPATPTHGPGMVLEYMSQGSLFDVLGNFSLTLSSKRKIEMAMDIAKGMSFLANLKPAMVHRDFKSLNILVDNHGTCKVSDFESATTVPEKAAPTLGSIPWTAPEVLSSNGRAHSLASDMYSFGVVLWEIATRAEPYAGLTVEEIMAVVAEGKRPDSAGDHPKSITGLPKEYASLVARCWSQSPAERPTIADVTRELAEMYATVASEVEVQAPSSGTRAIAFASKVSPGDEFKARHLSFLMTGRADSLALPSTTCAVFTDIAGFTSLSETMEPVAVANMLIELFGKFDAICEPLGGVLYKTMGDAYILLVSEESVAAVGGTEHPGLVGTRIALRMTEAAETVEANGRALKIRAGVNVGSAALQIMSLDTVEVVGDMMNLAARMEQTGTPGKVQVTESVHTACGDNVLFSSKSSVQVKGKGQVNTHFALKERA